MDKLWYYTQGASQEKKGPVPESEIRSLVANGRIQPTDLLWSEGMANWAPLKDLPQLRSSDLQTEMAVSRLSASAGGQTPIPAGLTGWMTFIAVMTIISGALYCLGCIWIIVGIPTIIAGVALLAAKHALAAVGQVDSSLGLFFAKLKTYVMLSGIVYIIGFVAGIVMFILYFGVIMSAIAGQGGVTP